MNTTNTSETPNSPKVTTKLRRKRPALSSCRGNNYISANIDGASRAAAQNAALLAREVFGVNANTSTSTGRRQARQALEGRGQEGHALPEGDERRMFARTRARPVDRCQRRRSCTRCVAHRRATTSPSSTLPEAASCSGSCGALSPSAAWQRFRNPSVRLHGPGSVSRGLSGTT